MLRTKRENLLPCGNNQIGDNVSKKLEQETLEKSIKKTIKILNKAEKIASQHRDIEALVVISDRWIGLAQRLKDFDKPKPIMLGFAPEGDDLDA